MTVQIALDNRDFRYESVVLQHFHCDSVILQDFLLDEHISQWWVIEIMLYDIETST